MTERQRVVLAESIETLDGVIASMVDEARHMADERSAGLVSWKAEIARMRMVRNHLKACLRDDVPPVL